MNAWLQMEEILKKLPKDPVPTLLLHSCCGPCSSSVLELLSRYFEITIYYYNPNIDSTLEFEKRFLEQEKLIKEMPLENPIHIKKGIYENDVYEKNIEEYRNLKEGSTRCFICYRMRLESCAKYAKQEGFDYFTTTLSVSPYKNAKVLNEIGKELSEKYNIPYLYADFKKKNGYKRSVELSDLYHLYRQNYCGCIYSKREALEREKGQQ
ncbi:MAG: epoxyqueuosine reductase QueH [Bacilli bacterium]|nr:epoxyqueuosine reductase QueH [Bacilli bacterium]